LIVANLKVVIPASLVIIFGVGAGLSILWCCVVLFVCMFVPVPISSKFPEIDFASKCVQPPGTVTGESLSELLYPLSNSTSDEIRRRLAGKRFFVGVEAVGERTGIDETNSPNMEREIH
jgi:hypothetical protein